MGGGALLHRSSSSSSGAAVKAELYVPTTRPSSRASAKSARLLPPSTVSAARTNIAPSPVFTVRGAVSSTASLTTRLSGTVRCFAHSSRTRSSVTMLSLTETPMIVSAAARKTPSTGLPSQANTPTTIATSCSIASTAARREGPPEPQGEVEQLADQRDADREQRLVPQLRAQGRADRLVPHPLRAAGRARPARPGPGPARRR